jgi:hypothetical protein
LELIQDSIPYAAMPNLPYDEYLCDYRNQKMLSKKDLELFKQGKIQLDYLEYELANIYDWQ